MFDAKRRILLKSALASGAVSVAVGAGLLTPKAVLAAWPAEAFNSTTADDAWKNLYGNTAHSESGDIQIKAPDIAENGAVVPVTVRTSISGAEEIALLVEGNGRPLAANFVLTPASGGIVSTRLKVAKSSKIVAMVKADGKLHFAAKDVKVTIGGCGG